MLARHSLKRIPLYSLSFATAANKRKLHSSSIIQSMGFPSNNPALIEIEKQRKQEEESDFL
ncbi:MAG: hypothetical protein K0R66_173 [Gammaproteobacteria bacterium]|jgi:hypothetical protein|nr:hypothetical protein [Gammaproteobacteria bacterium]